MKRYRLDPKRLRHLTPAQARRLATLPIAYTDIPPLGDAFFQQATAAVGPAKEQLTVRLDADVLKWLKGTGRGYHTRINRILRAAMEGQPPRRTRRTPASKRNRRTRHRLTSA